jgi:hypothetical protein
MSCANEQKWMITLALILFMASASCESYGQVSCPVSLTSAKAGADSIRLEFVNKAKVPIEELSLSCTPPPKNASSGAICHSDTGIFYPGNSYELEITYSGANRHKTVIAVQDVRLAQGISWSRRTSAPCKSLTVSRKN